MKTEMRLCVPTWYNLPWSEKIVICLSYPALPVFEVSVTAVHRAVEARNEVALPDILRCWDAVTGRVVV